MRKSTVAPVLMLALILFWVWTKPEAPKRLPKPVWSTEYVRWVCPDGYYIEFFRAYGREYVRCVDRIPVLEDMRKAIPVGDTVGDRRELWTRQKHN